MAVGTNHHFSPSDNAFLTLSYILVWLRIVGLLGAIVSMGVWVFLLDPSTGTSSTAAMITGLACGLLYFLGTYATVKMLKHEIKKINKENQ